MDSPIVTVAQLGCGYWGPNLLRNFSAQRHCRVKWVVEQRPERQQYVRENYPHSRVTADWQAVLEDAEVDAVVIATPAATHFELTQAALQAGKHAFVEKPLAASVAEADRLCRLADETSRVLMVGHTFLYNAAVRHVKSLIDDGSVGRVYYLYSQRLNLGQVRNDCNAWWNLAPHDVSILLYLMNGRPPVSVAARGVDYIQPGIEDVVFATLTWDDKVTAHVHVSWLDPGKTRMLTLVGDRRMVVYNDIGDDKIAVFDKGVERVPHCGEQMDYDDFNNYKILHRRGDVTLPKIDFTEPLRTETEHFLQCVTEGAEPLTGPAHARDVVAILEAGQRSLAAGGSTQSLAPRVVRQAA